MMSKDIFVIYNKATSGILNIRGADGRHSTHYYGIGAAKAALTRFCKKSKFNFSDPEYPLYRYAIAEREQYSAKIEQLVEKTNLMTGVKFMQSVNTPRSCDPSTELYWTM
jgi:hypothetical protein